MKLLHLDEYHTRTLQQALDEIEDSIVETIKLTSIGFPEQYDFLDKYGNQVAYMRLRYGELTVECPDALGTTVYDVSDCNHDLGWGFFHDDKSRIDNLVTAIHAIDEYYNVYIKTVELSPVDNKFMLRQDIELQDALEKLYNYESTNFQPCEIDIIRKKGPVMGYDDCIRKILYEHRYTRARYFPEANGINGINDKHIERELEWFHSTIDGLAADVKTVNRLFHKQLNEFDELFRVLSKKGNNALLIYGE